MKISLITVLKMEAVKERREEEGNLCILSSEDFLFLFVYSQSH